MASDPHVTLSGDIVGAYIVKETPRSESGRPSNEMANVPTSSSPADLLRSA